MSNSCLSTIDETASGSPRRRWLLTPGPREGQMVDTSPNSNVNLARRGESRLNDEETARAANQTQPAAVKRHFREKTHSSTMRSMPVLKVKRV